MRVALAHHQTRLQTWYISLQGQYYIYNIDSVKTDFEDPAGMIHID